MSDEEARLRGDMARAMAKLQPGLTVKAGGTKWEGEYATAYQALVRAGYEPQLRGKYRA